MSTKKKAAAKAASTGIRYSDALKQQVVDFVNKHNTTKGRGGLSAAAAKFKITPLTISKWLKGAGVKKAAVKVAKKAAAKVAKKAAGARKAAKSLGGKGVRYPDDFKQQVVDFVKTYNDKNGRGGQNQAAKKFKLSVLTVSSWLKGAGVKNPRRKPTALKVATKAKAKKAGRNAAKSGGSSELEALKAAIRKLIDA